MTNTGSLDTAKMMDARTALRCARLYLRGGKRRLEAGYSKAGIAALYDSVLFGMRYYIARHHGPETLAGSKTKTLFAAGGNH